MIRWTFKLLHQAFTFEACISVLLQNWLTSKSYYLGERIYVRANECVSAVFSLSQCDSIISIILWSSQCVHFQVFIYTMDRIVWLIVLTVVANFLFEFSGVMAGTKGIYGSPLVRAYQVERATSAVNPDDVELVDPMQASPTDGRSSRIKLFDNIFKARETTLLFDLYHSHVKRAVLKLFGFTFFLFYLVFHLITDSNFHAPSGKWPLTEYWWFSRWRFIRWLNRVSWLNKFAGWFVWIP